MACCCGSANPCTFECDVRSTITITLNSFIGFLPYPAFFSCLPPAENDALQGSYVLNRVGAGLRWEYLDVAGPADCDIPQIKLSLVLVAFCGGDFQFQGRYYWYAGGAASCCLNGNWNCYLSFQNVLPLSFATYGLPEKWLCNQTSFTSSSSVPLNSRSFDNVGSGTCFAGSYLIKP